MFYPFNVVRCFLAEIFSCKSKSDLSLTWLFFLVSFLLTRQPVITVSVILIPSFIENQL